MAEENGTLVPYVVQVAEPLERPGAESDEADVVDAWVDLPPVNVAPRTKRSTVIRESLKAAGMEPPEGGRLEVRVLGPETAESVIVLPAAAAPGQRELRL